MDWGYWDILGVSEGTLGVDRGALKTPGIYREALRGLVGGGTGTYWGAQRGLGRSGRPWVGAHRETEALGPLGGTGRDWRTTQTYCGGLWEECDILRGQGKDLGDTGRYSEGLGGHWEQSGGPLVTWGGGVWGGGLRCSSAHAQSTPPSRPRQQNGVGGTMATLRAASGRDPRAAGARQNGLPPSSRAPEEMAAPPRAAGRGGAGRARRPIEEGGGGGSACAAPLPRPRAPAERTEP